ncbi:flagellar filament capping protein FliD [Pseudomonas sp. dw_358]|uniref:flagellar filament capping protein FliD n=1 Tax=Pseudomonas sp. dw_358 TaxID=2720083 RepID=UPI001BD5F7AA|nr:flagellar filament capping protein FliD [Pseudomonas sp. dw_358]
MTSTISTGTTSTGTTASTASTASTTSSSSTSGTTSTSSSGAITTSGIGSGIDTASIVTALVNAEKAPKQSQIDTQTTIANTSLSAIGQLSSALSTYRTAIAAINNTADFNGLTGTVGETAAATATVDSTASTGTYTLKITNIATSSKVTSGEFAGKSTAVVNSGTSAQDLVITQSGKSINVSIAAGATLSQARDAINSAESSNGISANILTDASGSRLVLSSTTTGAGTDITVSAPSGSTLDSGLTGFTSQVSAVNANYSIDGIALSSSTNTVAAAISGVSLKLLAPTTSTSGTTITVGTDTSSLKTNVTTFMDAYNALMTTMNTLTKVTIGDDGTTSGGGLTGDSTVRNMMTAIRNQLVSQSNTSGITLAQLGVTTDGNTGLLTMSDTTWASATSSSSTVSAIQSLFTGKTGLLTTMTSATDVYAGSSGILAQRTTNLNTTISDLTTQQTALNTRIALLQTTLTAKYTAMDTLVAQLTATSTSVMTTLNALNKASST